MGLRAKLAIGFVVPLAVTSLAIALLEIGHTTQSSVDHLASLGNLLVRQIFEEMRADKPANLQALRENCGFRNFLSSVLAFGEGVVSVRIEDDNGITVVRGSRAPSARQLTPDSGTDVVRGTRPPL